MLLLPTSVKIEICSRLFLYLLEKKNKKELYEQANGVVTVINEKNSAIINNNYAMFKTTANNLAVIIKFAAMASTYSLTGTILYMMIGYMIGNIKILNHMRLLSSNSLKYTINNILSTVGNKTLKGAIGTVKCSVYVISIMNNNIKAIMPTVIYKYFNNYTLKSQYKKLSNVYVHKDSMYSINLDQNEFEEILYQILNLNQEKKHNQQLEVNRQLLLLKNY